MADLRWTTIVPLRIASPETGSFMQKVTSSVTILSLSSLRDNVGDHLGDPDAREIDDEGSWTRWDGGRRRPRDSSPNAGYFAVTVK